jgi:hypothetical protein
MEGEMTSHRFSYPKVVATRPGPSAYQRKTAEHKAVPEDQRGAEPRKAEPRKRRPAR